MQWELVALHHAYREARQQNEGIPIDTILREIGGQLGR
jgi:hypothetical protein